MENKDKLNIPKRNSVFNINIEKLKENYSLNQNNSDISNKKFNKVESSKNLNLILKKQELEINSFLQSKDEIYNHYKNEVKEEEEKNLNNSIFWRKKTIKKVWNKIRKISYKIKQKEKTDYQILIDNILNDEEDLAYKTLISKKFKKFYKNKYLFIK